jgi:hypothetical protein
LGKYLLGDDAVALHDAARNGAVALIGGVGNHFPAFGGGDCGGVVHGIVVAAWHAHDLGAMGGDRRCAAFAHRRMDDDDAAAMEEPRPPGDRAAVIAVGGAGHGDAFGEMAPAAVGERRRRHRSLARLRHRVGEQAEDGIGAPERLEALEAEAMGLVLEEEAFDAERGGRAPEVDERRRGVGRPRGDLAMGGAETVLVEHRLQRRAVERGTRHGAGIMKMRDGHPRTKV